MLMLTRFFVIAEGLYILRLTAIATGGTMIPSGNLSFVKKLWLDGGLGVEPRTVGIALADDLCDLRVETFWLKASMIKVGGP
jgi:hypothetical protein